MSAWLVALAAVVTAGQVELRRGVAELPDGTVVTAVSSEGVRVLVPGEAGPARPAVLGWHEVRAVGGEFAEPSHAFAALADKAWRAHSRLHRGDLVMAEPLLEELFPVVAGQGGPTARMVCDGLLRCRLRRGARVGAIEAWLAGVAAQEGSTSPEGNGLIDAATGLVPALPPVWIGTAGLQVWAAGEPRMSGSPGAALEELYRQAARFECGLPVALAESPPEEPGARLVWEIVQARAGGSEARAEARRALAARIVENPGGWREAWCRVGLGRSMLRETSLDTRRLGVVELLHLPARLADDSPYLAGVALAESAVELRRQGAEEAAWRLRSELTAGYPDHPALQWEALRGWAAPARPAKAASPPKEAPQEAGPEDTGPAGAQ